MLRTLIATSATWFTVPIRLGLGAVMIAHGAQKVLDSFNGPGFKMFGFFASNRGYEYPLSLVTMAVGLIIAGGGQASVDKVLSGRR